MESIKAQHFGIDLSPGFAVTRVAERSASDRHKLIAAQMVAQSLITDVQAQVADAREENELLLLQLYRVESELEDHYLRIQEQIKTNAMRDKELATARKTIRERTQKLRFVSAQEQSKHRELAALYASRSWKITRPLRFVRRLFKRKPAASKA